MFLSSFWMFLPAFLGNTFLSPLLWNPSVLNTWTFSVFFLHPVTFFFREFHDLNSSQVSFCLTILAYLHWKHCPCTISRVNLPYRYDFKIWIKCIYLYLFKTFTCILLNLIVKSKLIWILRNVCSVFLFSSWP